MYEEESVSRDSWDWYITYTCRVGTKGVTLMSVSLTEAQGPLSTDPVRIGHTIQIMLNQGGVIFQDIHKVHIFGL